MEKKEFVKYILNDEYMKWLAGFVERYREFDDCYFVHNGRGFLCDKDIIFIGCLSTLFDELNKYGFKNIKTKFKPIDFINIIKKDKKASQDMITFIVPVDKKKVEEKVLTTTDVLSMF